MPRHTLSSLCGESLEGNQGKQPETFNCERCATVLTMPWRLCSPCVELERAEMVEQFRAAHGGLYLWQIPVTFDNEDLEEESDTEE